jgi:hypothetical protein
MSAQGRIMFDTSNTFETQNQNSVIEVLNVPELARRLGCCEITLKRKVASSGTKPDVVLLLGHTRKKARFSLKADSASLVNYLKNENARS